MKQVLSCLLCGSLLVPPGWGEDGPAPSTTPAADRRIETLKHKALEIPAGGLVEVKLLSKEKLRGRMGVVTDLGFSLQYAVGDTVQERQITFQELKSVKEVGKPSQGTTAVTYGILGGLAALGTLLIIVLVRIAHN